MSAAKTILIAGAGIGGLAAALALAKQGFRIVLFETARELSEAGAGIQLSPNATRVLAGLGVSGSLRPYVSTPHALRVMNARSGGEIVRIPLGPTIEAAHGAPYWVAHRADLQRVLLEAVAARPEIVLRLGFSVLDFAARADGVTVAGKTRSGVLISEQGDALIGADGLWSVVRQRLGYEAEPRFLGRTAWRALVDASRVDPAWREPMVHLWLGPGGHLVHYPVCAGAAVNIVAIVKDGSASRGWAQAGERDTLIRHLARWSPEVRALLAVPADWQTWSLHDLPPKARSGTGPATLLGDASHAMPPYLAQGAAMAIEDAAVLAECAAREIDLAAAFRAYEQQRSARVIRAARVSAQTGSIYRLGGPLAAMRNLFMTRAGGQRLGARQDWLYRWRG